MSTIEQKTLNDFLYAMSKSGDTKTSAYDTTGIVRRVEGNTAWVHIPGGVDETPVNLTINASVGDYVRINVSGGRAYIIGNATSPPTDNTKANEAETKATSALTKADEADTKA
ncbi:MAG: hypothetical protein HUJ63_11865, partial [Enterococcus sp.]|nr:hypothetical protein [Enterococcus sp.]